MHSITPNLIAENVEESVRYYTEILGFRLENSVPAGNGLVWAQLTYDNVSVMLQERKSLEDELVKLKGFPTGISGTLFIVMNDIHAYYGKVRSRVVLLKEMERSFYGHDEFTIEDLNGYIITFSEPVE